MTMRGELGYSGKPLAVKLGIREGYRISLIQEPKHYRSLLGKLPARAKILGSASINLDFLHLFVMNHRDLDPEFARAKHRIKPSGSLWVSWPNLSSSLQSELNENIVREYCLSGGLVDVKVAAIDENWSGLKFVYRLKDRSPRS